MQYHRSPRASQSINTFAFVSTSHNRYSKDLTSLEIMSISTNLILVLTYIQCLKFISDWKKKKKDKKLLNIFECRNLSLPTKNISYSYSLFQKFNISDQTISNIPTIQMSGFDPGMAIWKTCNIWFGGGFGVGFLVRLFVAFMGSFCLFFFPSKLMLNTKASIFKYFKYFTKLQAYFY